MGAQWGEPRQQGTQRPSASSQESGERPFRYDPAELDGAAGEETNDLVALYGVHVRISRAGEARVIPQDHTGGTHYPQQFSCDSDFGVLLEQRLKQPSLEHDVE